MPDHQNIEDPFRHPLKGFEDAENDTMPVKDKDGNYIWIKADRRLFTDLQTQGNGTTALEVMSTYTMPANTLTTVGEELQITAWGSYNGINPANKKVTVNFGGVVVLENLLTPDTPTTADWLIVIKLYMDGAGFQQSTAVMYVNNAAIEVQNKAFTKDETTALVIDLSFFCDAIAACNMEGFVIHKVGGMLIAP